MTDTKYSSAKLVYKPPTQEEKAKNPDLKIKVGKARGFEDEWVVNLKNNKTDTK